MRVIKAGMLAALSGLALALPGSAFAASGAAIYHPDLNARAFATSDGGWERAKDSHGLCIAPLTCPSIGGGFVAGGGSFGPTDGYLETTISGLTGVGSESRGILKSPAFTYRGVDGQRPTALVFGLNHLSDISALLGVAGNQVDYSVEIFPAGAGGGAKRIVDTKPLIPSEGWTDSALVELPAGALVIGQEYKFRIITRFVYGAQVIPGGSVGYDDVTLLAFREEPGGGGDGGGNGGGGGGAGGNNAVFDGRNLFFKLKCFGEEKKGKCLTRATALTAKGGKRVTFPIQRVVKAKKGKIVRARVRFRFRNELAESKSVVLKSVLRTNRADKTKVTKYKKLKLIDRG